MTPAQILVDEHISILKGLNLLEIEVRNLNAGNKPEKDFWTGIIEFLRGYADRCHHAKEEKYFLPLLKEKGSEKYKAYVDVVFAEHQLGRAYIKESENAIEKLYEGDDTVVSIITNDFTDYIGMLRNHIAKENRYFVDAEKEYLQDDAASMDEQFEKTEKEELGEGEHEKYIELLNKLTEMVYGK